MTEEELKEIFKKEKEFLDKLIKRAEEQAKKMEAILRKQQEKER